MENNSVFSFSIKNEMNEIAKAVDKLQEFCNANKIPDNSGKKLYIVFDEILSNIIHYAYNDDDIHLIEISLDYNMEKGVLSMSFTDDGIPFDPSKSPDPDMKQPLEEREIGGLGIHIVRNLVDNIFYRRENNKNFFIVSSNL